MDVAHVMERTVQQMEGWWIDHQPFQLGYWSKLCIDKNAIWMCVWLGEWTESAASAQLSIIIQYKYQPIYHLIDEN